MREESRGLVEDEVVVDHLEGLQSHSPGAILL
jgi:hypothetical protein